MTKNSRLEEIPQTRPPKETPPLSLPPGLSERQKHRKSTYLGEGFSENIPRVETNKNEGETEGKPFFRGRRDIGPNPAGSASRP